MGNLSTYLQNTFVQSCPRGWTARKEARLLDKGIDAFLGYSSFADVLLEHESGRRIWVEFEVSRADPVANHATAHLFSPQGEDECFVSMVSAHIARGRRNLASSTTLLLRQMGMRAFQTVLLPTSAARKSSRSTTCRFSICRQSKSRSGRNWNERLRSPVPSPIARNGASISRAICSKSV